jgi:hypothetical protein
VCLGLGLSYGDSYAGTALYWLGSIIGLHGNKFHAGTEIMGLEEILNCRSTRVSSHESDKDESGCRTERRSNLPKHLGFEASKPFYRSFIMHFVTCIVCCCVPLTVVYNCIYFILEPLKFLVFFGPNYAIFDIYSWRNHFLQNPKYENLTK